jgi:hypothetical protein
VTTLKLSKRLSHSLKDTIIDRYLLSNFPAINVGMTHNPFTTEQSTKENTKQTIKKHNTTAHTQNFMCDATSECSYPYLV